MGHMYPEKLNELLLNLQSIRGWTTLAHCVMHAIKRGIGVSCAEGTYYEEHMYEMAFESILCIRSQMGLIEWYPRGRDQLEAVKIFRSPTGMRSTTWWEEGSKDRHLFKALYDTPFCITTEKVISHIEH